MYELKPNEQDRDHCQRDPVTGSGSPAKKNIRAVDSQTVSTVGTQRSTSSLQPSSSGTRSMYQSNRRPSALVDLAPCPRAGVGPLNEL
jgi:hypothetical protein